MKTPKMFIIYEYSCIVVYLWFTSNWKVAMLDFDKMAVPLG